MTIAQICLEELVEDRSISYGIVQPGTDGKDGVPIVRVGDLETGSLSGLSPQMRVAQNIEERFQRTRLRGGEVLVSLVGTTGRAAKVPTELAGWNVARAVGVLRPAGVEPDWLVYALRSPDCQNQISASLNTTVQATLNLADLKRIRIPMPSERVRRAIAEVLGALDDKIAANERVFAAVDHYCEALLDALGGGAPARPLSTIAEVNRASLRPGHGQLRYLDISSVFVGRYEWPELTNWSDAPGRARREVKAGDTVWSTVRPNRRSHGMVLDDDPRLVGSTGLAVLTPKRHLPALVYQVTKTTVFTSYLESVAEGSAYPAVRAERFLDAPIPDLQPDREEAFERAAYPARLRAHAAIVESRHLAALRDTLLPHLMSGRITVRDAQERVDAAL